MRWARDAAPNRVTSVSGYAIAQLPPEASSSVEMSASLAVVPEDVGHETAEFGVWTVMAIRVRGKDRFPRVQFHGELQAPSGFDSLVTVGMSLNGPIAIWSSRDGEAELHARYEQPPGGASFP
jgi:hypothetical protein